MMRHFPITEQLLSLVLQLTDFAVALLIGLPHKTFTTERAREHIIHSESYVFLFLVSLQICFPFEGLSTLKTVECGEKWGLGVFYFKVQF